MTQSKTKSERFISLWFISHMRIIIVVSNYSLDKETIVLKLNRNALTLNCKTIILELIVWRLLASPNINILIRPTHKVSEYGIKVNMDRILKRDQIQ